MLWFYICYSTSPSGDVYNDRFEMFHKRVHRVKSKEDNGKLISYRKTCVTESTVFLEHVQLFAFTNSRD